MSPREVRGYESVDAPKNARPWIACFKKWPTSVSCSTASDHGLDVLAAFDKACALRRQSDPIVPASSSATWRLEGFGRSGEPGGLGPAAYGHAQKGGDPMDIDQRGLMEVASP